MRARSFLIAVVRRVGYDHAAANPSIQRVALNDNVKDCGVALGE
jgi:hypothetical protein